jgi:predicted ATPase
VIKDEAELNRLRLFRRLSAALTAAPTLLLLEDVHWADEATLDILRFLGRRIEPIGTRVSREAVSVRPELPCTISPC